MDINSYTWLITILVVPATGFAASYFANSTQAKKADDVKTDLNKRMDEIKMDLSKSVEKAENSLRSQIEKTESGLKTTLDRNSDELVSVGKSITAIRTEIKHLQATMDRLVTALESRGQGQSASSR
jgi:chromosome segregation ATPase